MEADLTLEEVYNRCKEMKNSATGPDGIPYACTEKERKKHRTTQQPKTNCSNKL
jgi:hypothetical protein